MPLLTMFYWLVYLGLFKDVRWTGIVFTTHLFKVRTSAKHSDHYWEGCWWDRSQSEEGDRLSHNIFKQKCTKASFGEEDTQRIFMKAVCPGTELERFGSQYQGILILPFVFKKKCMLSQASHRPAACRLLSKGRAAFSVRPPELLPDSPDTK